MRALTKIWPGGLWMLTGVGRPSYGCIGSCGLYEPSPFHSSSPIVVGRSYTPRGTCEAARAKAAPALAKAASASAKAASAEAVSAFTKAASAFTTAASAFTKAASAAARMLGRVSL